MIKAIKNTSKESIDLGTMIIGPKESVVLDWDNKIITPEVFGLLMTCFNEGSLVAQDKDGMVITRKRKARFFKRNKDGGKNKKATIMNFDFAVLKLNEMYNELLNKEL